MSDTALRLPIEPLMNIAACHHATRLILHEELLRHLLLSIATPRHYCMAIGFHYFELDTSGRCFSPAFYIRERATADTHIS